MHHGSVPLNALEAVPVLAAGRIMVYEVRGDKLVFCKERLTLSRRPGFRSCRMLTESAGTTKRGGLSCRGRLQGIHSPWLVPYPEGGEWFMSTGDLDPSSSSGPLAASVW